MYSKCLIYLDGVSEALFTFPTTTCLSTTKTTTISVSGLIDLSYCLPQTLTTSQNKTGSKVLFINYVQNTQKYLRYVNGAY